MLSRRRASYTHADGHDGSRARLRVQWTVGSRPALRLRRRGRARPGALLTGKKKKEAEAAIPVDLLRATALVGPAGHVKERLAAYAQAGATTLKVTPLAGDHRSRVAAIE
ncbi:hypothetical protein Franean1_2725 [Parafrankia sp. EAN1pec]|nr:hypothetical protein Franean1_2725 [Frankia sp. EAN1pec]